MTELEIDDVLFERGNDGQILPQKVEIIGIEGKEITMLPLTRGEIRDVFGGADKDGNTTTDQDLWIIENKLLKPKIDEEKLKFMKNGWVNAIVTTILKHSGLTIDKSIKKSVEETEEDLKKKSESEKEKSIGI